MLDFAVQITGSATPYEWARLRAGRSASFPPAGSSNSAGTPEIFMSFAALAGRSQRAKRALRPLGLVCGALLAIMPSLAAQTASKQRLEINNYDITAELQPRTHRLVAHAVVKFTALEDISAASFELHNALRPTKVTDEAGKVLQVERISQDNTVRVALPEGIQKGQSNTLTFDYEGSLASADDSPVQGLKLAYVGDDTSYLLYSGRWFPMVAYGINRFTATIKLTVPSNWVAIGSGLQRAPAAASVSPRVWPEPVAPHFVLASYQQDQPPKLTRGRTATQSAPPKQSGTSKAKTPAKAAPEPEKTKTAPTTQAPALVVGKTYSFVWNTASFPGTIIAGQFVESSSNAAGLNLHLYFKP